jgi:hypothetical protein
MQGNIHCVASGWNDGVPTPSDTGIVILALPAVNSIIGGPSHGPPSGNLASPNISSKLYLSNASRNSSRNAVLNSYGLLAAPRLTKLNSYGYNSPWTYAQVLGTRRARRDGWRLETSQGVATFSYSTSCSPGWRSKWRWVRAKPTSRSTACFWKMALLKSIIVLGS